MNLHNGYRVRLFETRVGTDTAHIPKFRKGAYYPEFLSRAALPKRLWGQPASPGARSRTARRNQQPKNGVSCTLVDLQATINCFAKTEQPII